MIDTATLWINQYDAMHVVDRLENVQEITSAATGEQIVKGKLRNLSVTVKEQGVLVRGSLPKFYFDTNLTPVSRADVKAIIECLSEVLALKIDDASVFRLDIGANVIVNRPVREYLQHFGRARYFTQKDVFNGGSGVLYHNGSRSMCFYDKMLEMKKRKEAIPDTYTGYNVLRYELRYYKRLGEHLKAKPSLKAGKLYEERFYHQLVCRMQKEYDVIEKAKVCQSLQSYRPEGVKELQDMLALAGMQAMGGKDQVMEMLKSWRAEGGLNRTTHQRMKDCLRRLTNNAKLTETNELIEELNTKISEVIEAGK